MNIFQVENLSKTYAEKPLFRQITFGIDQGEKVALIAPNGAGKTTLLNIITGVEIPDEGTYVFRKDLSIAYLSQNPEFKPGQKIIECILEDDSPMLNVIKDYEALLAKAHHENDSVYQKQMAQLSERMDALGAWDYETKIRQILSVLKIDFPEQFVETLSGGQKKRVALAQALLRDAEFLILDEPTNHLDVEMVEWLEQFLARSTRTLFMVTHDRYFLDKVCNKIVEIDQTEVFQYKGNYSWFLEKKAERMHARQQEAEKARNLLRTETEWMRRQPQARATKAKARIDAFYELKDVASYREDSSDMSFGIQMARMGKKILELEYVNKSFGEKRILKDFSYVFKRKEKIGIIGKNGTGKSTFLNIISQRLKADSGKIDTGETIKIGYYQQDGLQFDEGKRVIDIISDIAEAIKTQGGTTVAPAQFLYRFNFNYDTQHGFVSKLSGGEKRRLYLLTVLLQNPNFLILDEPTNDLDIFTLSAIEDFLLDFEGCLIVVSHDRYFMDKLVDHIFVFEGDAVIKDFPGNYSQYAEYRQMKASQEKKEVQKEKKNLEAEKPRDVAKKKLSFKEKQEFDQLEKDMEFLETEKTQLMDSMSSGSLSPEELQKASARFAQLEKLLEEKTDRWLELSEYA